MTEPLFEFLDADEWRRTTVTRTRNKIVTEPRLQTIWFALPSHLGTCTVPSHDEVQTLLTDEQKVYRSHERLRYVYEIRDGLFLCRDCFLAGADRD